VLLALTALGMDMFLPSVPVIAQAFGAEPGAAQHAVTTYLLGLAVGQLAWGPLSDRYGRKPVLLAGLGLLFAASTCAARAPPTPGMRRRSAAAARVRPCSPPHWSSTIFDTFSTSCARDPLPSTSARSSLSPSADAPSRSSFSRGRSCGATSFIVYTRTLMQVRLLRAWVLALVLLNVPIAVALGVVAVVALVAATGPDTLPNLPIVVYNGATNFPLIAIPLFILAGSIMNSSGISRRLIAFASAVLGWIRGGLSIVAIGTSLFFAEISGSAVADVAARLWTLERRAELDEYRRRGLTIVEWDGTAPLDAVLAGLARRSRRRMRVAG